jgi:cleavage stimulation factor subunit 2
VLLQGPVVENPYGDAVDPDKAPEAISKAVASLPPEQMFELMKQMKLCCQVYNVANKIKSHNSSAIS